MAYVPSSAAIPVPDSTCSGRQSDRRIQQDACRVNKGRGRLFNTTASAASLAAISPQLGANGARILAQSETARASVLGAGTPVGLNQGSATPGSVLRDAPRVQPLNGLPPDMAVCGTAAQSKELIRVPTAVSPTMPQRVTGLTGPTRNGMAGVAPPWGDAGSALAVTPGDGSLMGWIKAHPWLAMLIAGGVVLVVSSDSGGRRGR